MWVYVSVCQSMHDEERAKQSEAKAAGVQVCMSSLVRDKELVVARDGGLQALKVGQPLWHSRRQVLCAGRHETKQGFA